MILLDHVVEILDLSHVDQDRAAEVLHHSADRADPSRVGSAAVDDDLLCNLFIPRNCTKGLFAASLLSRVDSMKSKVFPGLLIAQ